MGLREQNVDLELELERFQRLRGDSEAVEASLLRILDVQQEGPIHRAALERLARHYAETEDRSGHAEQFWKKIILSEPLHEEANRALRDLLAGQDRFKRCARLQHDLARFAAAYVKSTRW